MRPDGNTLWTSGFQVVKSQFESFKPELEPKWNHKPGTTSPLTWLGFTWLGLTWLASTLNSSFDQDSLGQKEQKIACVNMMASRGVRVAARKAIQAQAPNASARHLLSSSARALMVAPALEDVHSTRSHLSIALVAAAGIVAASASLAQDEARCDVKLSVLPSGAALASEDDASKPQKSPGKRHLLKSRTRHKAKLEEVDLMKIHLDEYKKSRATIDSLATRFTTYASKTIQTQPDGSPVAAMTFTDFVHSMVLPHFHTRLPHADVEYKCDFVGNADGLITYEECYLLIHLLQIPKEHFDVAFCMFDLDGDGAVDKDEFCHVIENLLRAITASDDAKPSLTISAEQTLPRLTKYLFGRSGKKQIRASELDAALDVVRKEILKAEFDLYAKPHRAQKGVSVISVHDFAITLLSCFDADRLPPYLERVELLNSSEELVTWDDFYKFHFHVQNHVGDIKLAFELTGTEEITEADFIHAAHVVTGVELPFPVVQLAFRVFDSNDNGTLDRSELMKVLEMRTNIDLQQRHTDSKLQRFWQCAKGQKE